MSVMFVPKRARVYNSGSNKQHQQEGFFNTPTEKINTPVQWRHARSCPAAFRTRGAYRSVAIEVSQNKGSISQRRNGAGRSEGTDTSGEREI